MQYISSYASPLGEILLSADTACLTGLWFPGQKYFARTLGPDPVEREIPVFTRTKHWLDLYFSGRRPDFTPPMHLSGTDFQRDVWQLLAAIPYGEIRTYGQVAQALAEKRGLPHMSAQAVGGAVGRNPISILIPCHRVVGAKGALTGYAGGIDRKRWLLTLEQAQNHG